jgi:hypothetical protein
MHHTPGPWFTEATSKIGHVAICDSDGFTICNPSPMGADNARLIAAAPDLLAALQAIREAAEGHVPLVNSWIAATARRAINKATGE